MRVWVTRTEPQAEDTAGRLRDLGHEALVAPVLMVRFLPINIDLSGFVALAFTSRNAVAAFARDCPRRDLPAYVTGAGTAADARAAGFAQVFSAEGDLAALADLIAEARPSGKVLHAAAAEPAGDLAGALEPAGIEVRTLPVYETVETGVAPPEDVDAVLIHSPRAAKAVAEVIRPQEAAEMDAYVISPAAAAPISYSNFRRVAVAPYPNEQALLKLFVS
ncbi:MAG: hemD [Caulobacteraceae bacterium]|nr:hemD [Caulobacteraceae bacterium]